MAGVNKIILVGRLTGEPEMSQLNNGTTIVKFGLATNEKYKDKEETEFHNIVAFAKTGQLLEQYLNKSDQVYLEGKNKTSRWDDKDTGKKMQRTDVVVSNFSFIDGNGAAEARTTTTKEDF